MVPASRPDPAGARLRRDTLPDQGKLHHKLLVLDDQVAIGGSFNCTGPANQYILKTDDAGPKATE